MFHKQFFSAMLCLFFLGQQSIEAQERRFNAGFLIGVNAAQIQGDDYAGYDKLGLLGGLTAQILFTKNVELGMEILYSQLGSRSVANNNNSNIPFKFKLNYMSIPVYYKYKDWYDEEAEYHKLHFLGGFSYGRLFGSEVEGGPGIEQLQDFFKKDYLGILFGATFYINNNWGIGARFERGLLLLYKNSERPNQPNHESLWDKHLSFYATYSL